MNTAGSNVQFSAPVASSISAGKISLWTRLSRALDNVFTPVSPAHSGAAAPAPSAEARAVSKRSTISSLGPLAQDEASVVAPSTAASRRPGLAARWKGTHRVAINHLA